MNWRCGLSGRPPARPDFKSQSHQKKKEKEKKKKKWEGQFQNKGQFFEFSFMKILHFSYLFHFTEN
jgi:hypothetical protein